MHALKLTSARFLLQASSALALALAVNGSARAQNGSVVATTGDARYEVPIEVPPGPAGHQPELALVYSSATHKGGSGYLGLGWSISGLSVIERDRKFGVPYDYGAPFNCGPGANQPCYVARFVLDGQDLIPDPNSPPQVTGKVRYRTQRDDGRLIQYVSAQNIWEVRDRSGRLLVYGGNADSRVVNALNGQTFSWHLRRVEDASGNWIDYSYTQPLDASYEPDRSRGVAYPNTIEYAQSGETSPNRCVVFNLDDVLPVPQRTDAALSYSAGFRQETTRRIARVVAWTGSCGGSGTPVGQYQLWYQSSPDSARSLLASVTRVSGDGTIALPGHAFQYSASVRAFDSANPKTDFRTGSGVEDPNDFAITFSNVQIIGLQRALLDVNSDGLVDLYDWNGEEDESGWYWPNDGERLLPDPVEFWQHPNSNKVVTRMRWTNPSTDILLQDVSGDGFLDLLRAPAGDWVLRLGSATALAPSQTSAGYGFGLEDSLDSGFGPLWTGRTFTDVTGDGLPDRVTSPEPPGAPFVVEVNRGVDSNTHLVMAAGVNWPVPGNWKITEAVYFLEGNFLASDYVAHFFDLNGDGLPDRIHRSGSAWFAAFGYGAGFDGGPGGAGFALANLPAALQLQPAMGCPTSQWADINGDGFPDLLEVQADQSLKVRFGSGTGFASANNAAWGSAAITCPAAYTSRFIDVDGDGLVDHVHSLDNIHLNASPPVDLLARGTGPLGGEVEFAYGPSTREVDAQGEAANPTVPFIREVVKTMTVRDGRAGTAAIEDDFAYAGGIWDRAEREFRGFATVTSMRGDGSSVVRKAVAAEEQRGCPGAGTEEIYDGTTLLRRTTNVFDSIPSTGVLPERYETCLLLEARVQHFEHAPQGQERVTRTTFEYAATDPFNLVKRTELGEVQNASPWSDVTSDAGRTVEFTYATAASPATRFLVSSPATITVKTLSVPSTTVSSREICYDGQACGTVSLGRPTLVRAYLIQESRWIDTKRVEYDAHGNVIRTHDASTPSTALTGGFRRTTTYDDEYATFPVGYTEGKDDSTPFAALRTLLVYDDIASSGTCAVAVDPPPPGLGLPCAILTPQGQRTDLGYDALGRTVEERYSSELVVDRSFALPTPQNPGVTTVTDLIHVDPTTTLFSLTKSDGLGRVFRAEESGTVGQTIVTESSFDAQGRLATETLPRFGTSVRTAQHFYDALGRRVRTIDFDGTTDRRLDYEPLGVVQQVYLGPVRGKYERQGADGFGRLASVAEYRDAATPGTPYITTAAYDAAGRLAQVKDPIGNDSSLCSIPEVPAGAESAACAAQQHTTTVIYDSLGRRTRLEDPDAGATDYTYDDAGMLISEADAAGNESHYRYDELNRLLGHQLIGPEDPGSSYSACFYYGTTAGAENFGLLTRVQPIGIPTPSDPCPSLVSSYGTEYQYEYDPESRLHIERQIQENLRFANEHSYDPLGRPVSRRYPDGERVVYGYDGAFLASITSDPAYDPWITGIEHDALGRVTAYTVGSHHGTAVELDRTFDSTTGRLSQIHAAKGQTVHMNLALTIDGLGRTRTLAGEVGGNVFPDGGQQFSYDGLGRLQTAVGAWEKPQGIPANVDWTFSYDALGNLRKQDSSSGALGYQREWFYAGSAGIPSVPNPRPHFATRFEEKRNGTTYFDTFAADAAGKVDSTQGSFSPRDYQWNRLGLFATQAGSYSQNRYDIFGRRTYDPAFMNHYVGDDFEYRHPNFGGFGTKFFWLGGQRVATRSTPYVAQPANGPDWAGGETAIGLDLDGLEPLLPGASAVGLGFLAFGLLGLAPPARFRRRAAWLQVPTLGLLSSGLVLLPIRPLLAAPPGENAEPMGAHDAPLLAYLPDHLGTTRGVVNILGALVETREYDPFGREVAHTGDYALKHQWTQQPRNSLHELDHYGARMYSAKWGRFLSPDPLVTSLSSSGLNRYAYVANDPMSQTDPTGMCSGESPGGVCITFGVYLSVGEQAGLGMIGGGGVPGWSFGRRSFGFAQGEWDWMTRISMPDPLFGGSMNNTGLPDWAVIINFSGAVAREARSPDLLGWISAAFQFLGGLFGSSQGENTYPGAPPYEIVKGFPDDGGDPNADKVLVGPFDTYDKALQDAARRMRALEDLRRTGELNTEIQRTGETYGYRPIRYYKGDESYQYANDHTVGVLHSHPGTGSPSGPDRNVIGRIRTKIGPHVRAYVMDPSGKLQNY